MAAARGTCDRVEAHSLDANHTHYALSQDPSATWDAFPASGNHWGAWAKWYTAYPRPVLKGFVLHNLEHGGIVFSYRCASNTGATCKAAEAQMISLARSLGGRRFIVTPDPTQPALYGIRAWRWTYLASCLD